MAYPEDNLPIPGPGRNPIYTEELGEKICVWIASGKSLNSYCEAHPGDPDRVTIQRWLRRDEPEFVAFRHKMALAREDQSHALVDENIDLKKEAIPFDHDGRGDNASVQDKKLRIDTNFKMAAIMLPRVYAPVTKNEVTGKNGGPIETRTTKELTDAELERIAAAGAPAAAATEAGDAGGSGTGAPGEATGA